jgi:phage-related protein
MEVSRKLPKPLRWVASAKKDLVAMPRAVQRKVGFALYLAQIGGRHLAAKALKGFGSAGVLEVVEDHQADTYRAVYTVRLKRAIYVLHCFKKKSVRGAETPKPDVDLIRARLRMAELLDEES